MVANHSECTVTFPDGIVLPGGDTFFEDTQPLSFAASGYTIEVAHLQPALLAPRVPAPRPTLVAPVEGPPTRSGAPPRPPCPPPQPGLPAWALKGDE